MEGEDHYPMALPCLHIYCRECLTKLTQQGNIKCPNCEKVWDSSDVQKDFRTVGLVDDFKKNSQVQQQKPDKSKSDILCEMCEEMTGVVSKCNSCNMHLCAICNKSHNKMFPQHKKVLLAELVNEIQKKIRETQNKSHMLMETGQSALKDINKTKDEVRKQKTQALDAIDKSCEETMKIVNKQHDELKQKLNRQVLEFTASIDKAKVMISKHNEKLQDISVNLDNMLTRGTTNTILSDGNTVLQCVQKGKNKI
jgi:multidrug efflux pump subunit AcrB